MRYLSRTTKIENFYFPGRRLLVTNCMPYGAVFNVYSLRGASYRNPAVFVQDARWVESKNAAILLDIHGPTLKGEDVVRDAVQRAVDQVQLIRSGAGPRPSANPIVALRPIVDLHARHLLASSQPTPTP